MRIFIRSIFQSALLIIMAASVTAVFAQNTEFTYQGKLSDAGGQAATYDMQFRLCATESATCSPVIATYSLTGVPVSSAGIFTVRVIFPSGFNGSERYLEIDVKRTGQPTYTTLAPRQKVTMAPYARYAVDTAYFNNMPLEDFVLQDDARLQANYNIRNTMVQQAGVNFNIGGTGTASSFNATSQYSILGSRILSSVGSGNLFVGFGAGSANSATGSSNSFFGTNAGGSNTTGDVNTFVGTNAGLLNTTASANTFVGGEAGRVSTGSDNTFIGANSGLSNSTGASNSFVGSLAGGNNTGASNNSFFGFSAGVNSTTGGSNSSLGSNAGPSGGTISNSTAIGANASASTSNVVVLGSIAGTNGATADTRVGIGTTAPNFKLQVVDPLSTGLRVQTNSTGGTVASFGGNGAFQVDSTGVAGGRFTVLENGNVGIGDATPSSKLSVSGTGSASTALEISNGGIKVPGSSSVAPAFTLTRNAGNTCGDWIVIDSPYSNGNPNAMLWVTTVMPNRSPGTFSPGVYYETNFAACPQFNNKWAIIAQGSGDYNPQLKFNVLIITK